MFIVRFLTALVVSAVCLEAFAQIEAPKEVEPYSPIIVSYSVPVKADAETKVTWRGSSESVKYEAIPNTTTLHVWAPPGDHWIEATVATQTFRELLVLVPDPAAPTDLSKAKSEKVKISLSFAVDRHTANFKVKGAAPVVPDKPVVPVPVVDVPTAEMQALIAPVKTVMLKGDPAKAAVWAGVWADYLFAVKTSSPLKTSAEFKSSCKAFTNAAGAKAGLENAFPGFTQAMDAAFASRFGAEDGPLDWNKAIEFVSAVVWATSSK